MDINTDLKVFSVRLEAIEYEKWKANSFFDIL